MLKNERLSIHIPRPGTLLVLVAGAALFLYARRFILPAVQLIAGGALIAFLLEPAARLFEKRFSRGISAFGALFVGATAVGLFCALLIPALVRQLRDLIDALPAALEGVRLFFTRLTEPFRTLGIGVSVPSADLNAFSGQIDEALHGIIGAAENIAGLVSRFSLMIVLSFFLLRDRKKLFLHLEMLFPLSVRRSAVLAGMAVCRELRLYLRGQAAIAFCVGALASFGLMLVGVPSALVLGLLVGTLNMIPYLGPILGAVPTLLIAFSRSPATALWAAIVLILVQQTDGSLISPRIMGNLTGFSPAVVLIAVFVGGQATGIAGMLVALPLLMTVRTCLRIFMQKNISDKYRTESVFPGENPHL